MNLGLADLQSARTDPSRVEKGINALNQCLALNKDNLNAIYYLSQAYQMAGNKQQADYLREMLRQKQQ